jgi:thiamine pyrophosphate-dependent acetolactate synthase large subunit-like protein
MAELTGSEILAKALKREGTDNLFFLMGGPMLLAESSCIKEGIRPIEVRHEQAAALMGQAYSRLLQKPSVARLSDQSHDRHCQRPNRLLPGGCHRRL